MGRQTCFLPRARSNLVTPLTWPDSLSNRQFIVTATKRANCVLNSLLTEFYRTRYGSFKRTYTMEWVLWMERVLSVVYARLFKCTLRSHSFVYGCFHLKLQVVRNCSKVAAWKMIVYRTPAAFEVVLTSLVRYAILGLVADLHKTFQGHLRLPFVLDHA